MSNGNMSGYVSEIKQSLAKLDIAGPYLLPGKNEKVRDVVKTILMDLGIICEYRKQRHYCFNGECH